MEVSATRRACRISSSQEAISANDGDAAISRPVAVGSATAAFAASLAALPATSSAHGNSLIGGQTKSLSMAGTRRTTMETAAWQLSAKFVRPDCG